MAALASLCLTALWRQAPAGTMAASTRGIVGLGAPAAGMWAATARAIHGRRHERADWAALALSVLVGGVLLGGRSALSGRAPQLHVLAAVVALVVVLRVTHRSVGSNARLARIHAVLPAQVDVSIAIAGLTAAAMALLNGRLTGESPAAVSNATELVWGAGGVLLVAAAGRLQPTVKAPNRPLDRTPRPTSDRLWPLVNLFAGPAIGACSAVGVLGSGQFNGTDIGPFSPVLAIVTLVVASARSTHLVSQVKGRRDSGEGRTDALTDLASRQAFYEGLRRSLADRDPADGLAVLVIDIDRFKEINDSLGHVSGDELLCHIADRLAAHLEPGEILARLGGDEFGLVLVGNELRARATARRLRRELDAPFLVSGLSLRVEASVGIALWPTHGAAGERLLARADIAMYRAKSARSGVEVFRFQGDDPSRERLASIEALRAALPRDEIRLHYQPKIDVSRGDIVGFEALARWRRPDGRMISPTIFIPLAEHAGLMPDLTRVVLDGALHQMAEWDRRDVRVGSMAVNVSATCLLDPGFPAMVVEALGRSGIGATRLTIEITEDTVVGDPELCGRVLSMLRRVGVRLSLDDYGTGYSSLSMLRQLPLDELKLDRSFGLAADLDPRAGAIVRSTAALARDLGLTLVAEGIETAETMALLRECGCQVAQGFLFATALPAHEVEEWLLRLPELGEVRARAETG